MACAAALAVGCTIGAVGCSSSESTGQRFAKAVEMSASVTSLQVVDEKVGTGAEATPGRTARAT